MGVVQGVLRRYWGVLGVDEGLFCVGKGLG